MFPNFWQTRLPEHGLQVRNNIIFLKFLLKNVIFKDVMAITGIVRALYVSKRVSELPIELLLRRKKVKQEQILKQETGMTFNIM